MKYLVTGLALLLALSAVGYAEINEDRNEYLCRIDAAARDGIALLATDNAGLSLNVEGKSDVVYYLEDYRRLTKSLEEEIRSADRFAFPGEMILAASKVYECADPGANGKGYCDKALSELEAYVKYEGFVYVDYVKQHCDHGESLLSWSKDHTAYVSFYLQ